MRRSVPISIAAVGLVLVAVALASTAAAGGHRRLRDGATFVAVVPAAKGGTSIELRSARSGAVLKVVGTFGQELTNNGLALTPDGRGVFVTLTAAAPGRRALRLERVAVADGARTPIARGEQPAISPDGRLLAYAGAGEISVRDLATGMTRAVEVSRYLGSRRDLVGATMTWLGDGSEVVVVPTPVAIASTLRRGAPVRVPGRTARPVVILVRVRRGPLRARSLSLPGLPQGPLTAAGASARPGSFLLAFAARGDAAVIYEITPGAARAKVRRVLAVHAALVIAIDRTGTRVLYVLGHGPPALWAARISGPRLTARHRLIRNSPVQAAAW